MQDIVLAVQLRTLLWALLFGAGAAAVYDGVRFVRAVLFGDARGSITAANIFDILFGIAMGCAFSVFLFIANSGRFRWYLLFAAVMGFALYRLAPGKVIFRLVKWLAMSVRRLARAVFGIIYFPVSILIKSVKTAAGKIKLRRHNKRKEKEKQHRKEFFCAGRAMKRTSDEEERNRFYS